MASVNWTRIYLIVAGLMIALLLFIFWAVPRDGDEWLWTDQMIPGGWMAWSFPIALFFWCIGTLLVLMTILAVRFPETPRVGILGIETTRGDRLFITLLGSAFLNLGWMGFEFEPQWQAVFPCAIWAFIVFRWV